MIKKYLTLIILILINRPLTACDMFMLQSINNYPFFTMPINSGSFNDPYDYFEEFKSLANGSSGNRDGYGIVAYQSGAPLIDRDFMWYKTGMNTYFDETNPDEPLYEAISVLSDNPTVNRIFVHARSGTGGLGNHPFVFDYNNSTFTFMHNGYVFNSVKSEIMNFLGEAWFDEHPSQWQGVFGSPSSFIDSELLFHYLMYYILQYPDDIPTAFRHAFNNKELGNVDMEFIMKYNNSTVVNFILSDSENTYVYRSSEVLGKSYNLSYQIYPNNYVAVKTNTDLAHTLEKNQIIKITPQGEIIDLSLDPILRTNFLEKFVDNIDTNLYKLQWQIQPNQEITSFNIYRGMNQNFTNAMLIATVDIESSNQEVFSYLDSYAFNQIHYYWIEVNFTDETSELTSNIPSETQDHDDDIDEALELITLYPNPFRSNLSISIDSDEIYQIKVYNLKGQLVDKITYRPNQQKTINWDSDANMTKKLPSGIYILKFSDGKRTITKKVMKIR
ncbi:T9SS type A sorting domain-containing protein [bacterium]|nr:T9SS type A sorting domain-containing protein [bacterium]